jgi:UDP-glucuronate decarboxylase
VKLAETQRTESVGMPFNIGNPVERTVRELAERVLELTGGHSAIEPHPLPEDDPKVRCPDISRARDQLEWEPVVDIADGLALTIEYFRKVLG